MRLVEQVAPGDNLVEGLGYAIAGQTRRLGFDSGRIGGAVQGTSPAAYETSMTLAPFTHDQGERVIAAMIDQAVYAAKLLAGELPANIEDVFAPLGLRLFPIEPSEVTPTCNCRTRRMTTMYGSPPPGSGQPGRTLPSAPVARSSSAETPVSRGVNATADAPSAQSNPDASSPDLAVPAPSPWCKHVCCLAYLVAERFTTDPFLIFTLRGLPREELLERLRQRRVAASSGAGGALVYAPVVPGVSDKDPIPLEQTIPDFWDAGPGLEHLDTPLEKPEVSHPLLRRLGPSPFGGPGRFPLVGLLATCYDVISEAAIKGDADAAGAPNGEAITDDSDQADADS